MGAHVDGVVTEEQLLEVVSPSLSAVGLVCVTAARSCLSVAAGTAQADAVDHSVAGWRCTSVVSLPGSMEDNCALNGRACSPSTI